MNNERMIAVSSDLIERAISLLDLLPESGTIIELRAALATQPAGGEPVAWIIESPEGCSPCKSINHFKHMAERYAAVGWSVTPLYAAPPAAAHGDDTRRIDWLACTWRLGGKLPDVDHGSFREVIDAAMRAQGDGEVQ